MGRRVRSSVILNRVTKPAAHKDKRQSSLPRPVGKEVSDFVRWAHDVTELVVCEYLTQAAKPKERERSAQHLHVIMREFYRRHCGGTILIRYLPPDDVFRNHTLFLGMIVRKKEGNPIIYLNPCQTTHGIRLGLTLESFQALLDHKAFRTKRPYEAVKDLLAFRKEREWGQPKPETIGEIIAEIAAMEALFPYNERTKILKSAQGRALTERAVCKLAKLYGIPERWVRIYTSKDTMRKLKQYHSNKTR